ncbi:L,D-transpeptidase family protein [Jatrophihabitans sp. YIM 134969]
MSGPVHDASPARSGWLRVVERFGWRAYAVPVLLLVTIAVLVRPGGSGAEPPAAAGTPASTPVASSEELSAPVTLAAARNPQDATICAGNSRPQWFVVSIRTQHAWACDTNRLRLSTPVTTGVPIPSRETRVGTWTIQYKQTDRDLVGPGYSEHVEYWMPYDGDFGLHDAQWQTFTFGTAGWRTDGSHGCVHLPTDAMGWVYRWAQVGTVVTIDA